MPEIRIYESMPFGSGPRSGSFFSKNSSAHNKRFVQKQKQPLPEQRISGSPVFRPKVKQASCCWSDLSKACSINFNGKQINDKKRIPRPEPDQPSCCQSDMSLDHFIEFKENQINDVERQMEAAETSEWCDQESPAIFSGQKFKLYQTKIGELFELLKPNIIFFVEDELEKYREFLSGPDMFKGQGRGEQADPTREAMRKIVIEFLRSMNLDSLADLLHGSPASIYKQMLKDYLKEKSKCLSEGIRKAGDQIRLNQIYTELVITEGGTGDVNNEHEVRQIETVFRTAHRPEVKIKLEDIFKTTAGKEERSRTVMTKGVAGIGKTVLTQKFTLDWAENNANHDIDFTFPFTFRELNVLKKQKFSLLELIHYFFGDTKEVGTLRLEQFQVLFIFDGLDECRFPLDFQHTKILTDVTKSTSVDVLLTNLIRGNLLPSAYIWITTRPAASNLIPPGFVDMVTEVRGFTDPQKDEYFRKKFTNEEQAASVISNIKKSRTLHIMCHIPIFCWITATVLEVVSREVAKLPKTLTEMYIYFVVVHFKLKNIKYNDGAEIDQHWNTENKTMIVSLGKLAFEQLQKGNLIFYESDLTESGIDIEAASVYSGVLTSIFREEKRLYQERVFCFIHLSVQEFLAALHVHLTFINSGVNLLSKESLNSQECEKRDEDLPMTDLYQSAVDQALGSPNGHLDLFLRFLLGLALPENQTLLRGLLRQTGGSSVTKETIEYVKKKIEESPSGERSFNLFHCLNELNDSSLVEEVQLLLQSGKLSFNDLAPGHWSALCFNLLLSEKDLDVFDLKKYFPSEGIFLRMLPAVKASKRALYVNQNHKYFTHPNGEISFTNDTKVRVE